MAQALIAAQGIYGFRRNAPNPVQMRFGEYPPGPIAGRPWQFGPRMTEAIRDGWLTQTLEGEAVIPAGTMRDIDLGILVKHARQAHMKATVINPDGSVVLNPNLILTFVKMQLMGTTGPIYTYRGSPALGIVFFNDFSAGQSLYVFVDNTDPRSALNGQTIQLQLFVNCDPRYDIETTRKGNANT